MIHRTRKNIVNIQSLNFSNNRLPSDVHRGNQLSYIKLMEIITGLNFTWNLFQLNQMKLIVNNKSYINSVRK